MSTVLFLAEWALRSSALVSCGALLLWLLRVKDPAARLAAWTAILFGSLTIPALTLFLPTLPIQMRQAAAPPAATAIVLPAAAPVVSEPRADVRSAAAPLPFNWAVAALAIYAAMALTLLLRLAAGLRAGLRLLRGSHSTGIEGGVAVRESADVAAPVALGILRPVIVLPADWREWDVSRLEAVLAHERSHVERHDPAIQMLALLHRALLWFSPLSWFLHTQMVRAAEEASDDAAVTAIGDRVLYAEVLLDFTRRGGRNAVPMSTPMARYGPPEKRIHRILDGATLSRGVTRGAVAAILAIGSPLAYVVAAARPQNPAVQPAAPQAAPVRNAQSSAPAKPTGLAVRPQRTQNYISAQGNAVPSATVTVTSRVDGQLQSVNFKEGDQVEAGQLLATVDPTAYRMELSQAEAQLQGIQAALANASAALARSREMEAQNAIPHSEVAQHTAQVQQLEAQMQALAPAIQTAKLHLTYTSIVAPISGVLGFRLLDPGNMVHAGDGSPIVVINQLQPMMVVFPIPAESLPRLRALHAAGTNVPAEIWTRDGATRLDTGHVIAVDNQVQGVTGLVKVKAEFENKNRALLPNQTVTVRLLLQQ